MIYYHVYKVTLLTIIVKHECNAYNYASSNIISLVVKVCLTIAILVKVLKSKWLEIIYAVKWWIFIYLSNAIAHVQEFSMTNFWSQCICCGKYIGYIQFYVNFRHNRLELVLKYLIIYCKRIRFSLKIVT